MMADSILLYLGLAVALVGLLSVLWPLRFLYIRTRWLATIVAAAGLFLMVVTLSLPVRAKRTTTRATKLDDWMPAWQFGERHEIHVEASPEKVFAAIHAVRAKEILFFRMLTAIRRCGHAGPESILNAPEEQPLLAVATQTTFLLLSDEPPRELVIGTVIAGSPETRASGKLTAEVFRKRPQRGVVLAAMNFIVRPDEHGGSRVTTETRVNGNGGAAVRRFAIYWRMIHPGSDIIRRMWLRAIKLRAES
jgi:hypothetical protein